MTPDMVNGAFELVGAVLTFQSFLRVERDKGYAGIYWPAVAFFTAWGLWNLFYYPSLNQQWSFIGGVALVCANVAWLAAMCKHGPLHDAPGN
jgi:hypothetical protein